MSNNDHLEKNVEQLLTRARPELGMPQASKRKVLKSLQASAAPSWKGRLSWTAVAAAAAILTFFFWPWGMNGGVAWADVVKHFNDVQSVTARVIMESSSPTGEKMVSEARLYQKDPGRSRSEMLAATADRITYIVISNSGLEESWTARLSPDEKVAHITSLSFSGRAIDPRAEMPRDLVAESWTRLKEVTADETKSIGEGEVDGESVVGFEIDIWSLFKDPAAVRMDGVVRVWADRRSGVPLEVETEFTDPAGRQRMTTFSEIEWNPQLSDEMFTIPDMRGWQVAKEKVEETGFLKTALRHGVTLTFGPPSGPPILTERDITAVRSGTTTTFGDQGEIRRQVSLVLTADAAERLREYSAAHIGQRIIVDFNGEVRYELTIGGRLGTEILIDINALGVTLEEFEDNYLR
jgi:outer membrane lipoprotein-sorting protein